MSKSEPVILPEKYYLDYFNYVLEFVEKQYDHVLDMPEHLFYQSFRNLSEQAQCLYLRFSNRRGDFFRINKVSYAEIPDLHEAKSELIHHGFIQINESDDPIQFNLFTKNELIEAFDFLLKPQKKSELLGELTIEDLVLIHEREEVAQVLKNEEVEFIKLLFFGNRYGGVTDFVIRDVGNVKIEKLESENFKPWFQSREEALAVMHVSQLRRMVRDLLSENLPLEDYLEDLPWHVWLSFPQSAKSTTKLLLKVAYYFEQVDLLGDAIKYYSLIDQHPARERRIRILEKQDKKEEAIKIANQILDKPSNASELTFATDYLNRKGIRINRSMTERLKSAPSISIPTPQNERVENAVLSYFEELGWDGTHAENYLWRGLFGLVFWEIIFDTRHGSFHHPLQRQPSDLNDATFFETRQNLLEEKLRTLRTKKQLETSLKRTHDEKMGTANRFVTWHKSLLPNLTIMASKIPLKSLKKVLIEMSKNMKENSTGFPDLFLWNNDEYIFYEVKSPNDQLSAQQLFWLDFLQATKIKVDVLRVQYSD
ncbi:VRR-NUC domain-containing protein [Ekhidna sp.]